MYIYISQNFIKIFIRTQKDWDVFKDYKHGPYWKCYIYTLENY